MDLIARLDRERAAHNVLEHPFYARWSAGALTAGELALYAGEYRHAVAALTCASQRAASKAPAEHAAQLREHAREEAAHEELWEQFARAAGAREPSHEDALAQTDACAQAWTAGEDVVEHLAVLYAIEASQPAIAQTKLEGLVEHYGYVAEGPAAEYFTVHAERDHEHARQARELITGLLAEAADTEERSHRAVLRAREALRGNWLLLDGVEMAAARAAVA